MPDKPKTTTDPNIDPLSIESREIRCPACGRPKARQWPSGDLTPLDSDAEQIEGFVVEKMHGGKPVAAIYCDPMCAVLAELSGLRAAVSNPNAPLFALLAGVVQQLEALATNGTATRISDVGKTLDRVANALELIAKHADRPH